MSNTTPTLPRFIAICGNPKSGKSLVQEILFQNYGVQPIDDGEPMRDFAIRHLGLTYEDCYTQEGKLRFTNVLGEDWQNRKILGELGNRFEEMFGKHIMPWMAVQKTKGRPGSFSFGSVRRDQGAFYKSQGPALILEVDNPLASPSPYEFDRFDREIVDIRLNNDGLAAGMSPAMARRDLEIKVADALASWALKQKAAA